jgi:hypothetical protein
MRTNSRKLSIEKLEKREVFAGDVAAFVNNGVLQLNGDNLANDVEIHSLGNHNYAVNGLGTTVNHSNQMQTFHATSDKIVGNLKGGDDYVYLHDSTINQISLTMGDGNDNVYINNVNALSSLDGVQLDMGNGNDLATLEHDHIFGNLSANMGAGNDTLKLNSTNVDFLFSVDGGAGSDTFARTKDSKIGHIINITSFETVR